MNCGAWRARTEYLEVPLLRVKKYGLVASTQPESLQRAFDVLTGLFDRVILRTNRRKTVSMACHPLHASVWMSSEAYEQQKMGTGTIF